MVDIDKKTYFCNINEMQHLLPSHEVGFKKPKAINHYNFKQLFKIQKTMRATDVIKIVFAIFAITACSNESDWLSSTPTTTATNEKEIVAYPKAMGMSRNSENIGFWEQWERIEISGMSEAVHTPWDENISGGAIPDDIRTDIKYENGWDLIAHTVNGYGEPGMNYLIFHNRYTGILKGFYYLPHGTASPNNTAIWELYIEKPHSLFAFLDEYAKTSEQKENEVIRMGNIVLSSSRGFTPGWNCFQTELSYDPSLTNATLKIMPKTATQSTITINGDIDMETNGTIISYSTSNDAAGIVNFVSRKAGNAAKDWVNKALKADKFLGFIPKVDIVNGARDIVNNGISTIIGAFTGGFDENEQTVHTVQLQSLGTVTMEGKVETPTDGIIMPLTISISPEKVGRLGAWSMAKNPSIKFSPYSNHKGPNPISVYNQIYNLYVWGYPVEKEKIAINPDIFPFIKKYDVQYYLYDTNNIVRKAAFEDGDKNSYQGGYHLPELGNKLYENRYKASLIYGVDVYLKDVNGEVLVNCENPPYEIFIPNVPNGPEGAVPNFNCDSRYVITVEIKFTTNDNKTMVSTHTFIPTFEWNYDSYNDGLYNILYPAEPIMP